MTSKSKHTPGPWFVVPYGDGDQKVICRDEEGNWRIAFMATSFDQREELAEIRANARLISAAPDMAEALKALIADIEDYELVNNLHPSPGKSDCWQSVSMARAALKKAGV